VSIALSHMAQGTCRLLTTPKARLGELHMSTTDDIQGSTR
jgi:hypothetical protein